MADTIDTSIDVRGSDAWRGVDDLAEDHKERRRANAFCSAVRWDVLRDIVSQHNGGKPCRFHDKFSLGYFNIVKRVSFEGGEDGDAKDWVVRLRMPNDDVFQFLEKLGPRQIMEVEVASMKFFKTKTSIPVPAVIAYDTSPDNAVGAPYIIMEYIHGDTAKELSTMGKYAASAYGNAEQDRKFRRQVAEIQATVSSFTFPQIGSLYVDDQGEFKVGPDVMTGGGPWSTSAEYYDEVVHHIYDTFPLDERRAGMLASTALFVPSALSYLARVHAHESSGPFRLVNCYFGTHNILVSDDFDVVGVISFDGVMAAPAGVVAQYPLFIGFEVEEIDEEMLERLTWKAEALARNKPRLDEYNVFLRNFEDVLEKDSTLARPSDRLDSREALVYSSMMCCHNHQKSTNDMLQRRCLRMLKACADGAAVVQN